MNPPPSYPPADDIDIGALWRAVAEKKVLLAGVVLAAGVATFIALQFVTPLYTSQARILIEPEEASYLSPRSETGSSEDSDASRVTPEAVASQVQVLLSRDLARQVVEELDLQDDPEFTSPSGLGLALGLSCVADDTTSYARSPETFEQRLSVYQIGQSRVIAVDFESRNPETAADVVNYLGEAYLAWQQKTKLEQNRAASQWLSEQISNLREKVAESEAAVEEFRSSSGLISGSNNVSLDAQELSELNSQLILARAQRSEARARANQIRRMLEEEGGVETAPDVLQSTLIQRLLEQRVSLRRELAELSASLMPSHPRILQLKSELDDLQEEIRQEAKKIVSSLENEAEIADARVESLKASLEELKQDSSQTRSAEIKLRSLEREAKADRDLLESYLARYSEASARREKESVPAYASIIARGYAANEPSFPRTGPISALVAAAAGLLSLAGIVARELMTGSHHAGAHRRGEPAAPSAPDRDAPPAWAAAPDRRKGKRRPRARSARDAAKRIRAKCTGAAAHTVIVSSAISSADAAQDSLDIARVLSARGLSVAIVDFSTSGEGVADLAGLPQGPGLGELLQASAGFEDVIRAEPGSGVQIIPPGALRMEALTGERAARWARIHDALRQIYDCLILHTGLSGARRLIDGMREEPITVLLVTGGESDAALEDEIAAHLSENGAGALDLMTYVGAGRHRSGGEAGGLPREAAVF
jgi:uncharacterized protein involved in exopolysaccharide biosynthesis